MQMIRSWYLTEAIFVAFLQFAGFLLILLVIKDQIFLPMLLTLAWRSLLIAVGHFLVSHVLPRTNLPTMDFIRRMLLTLVAYALIYTAINVFGPMVTGNTVERAGAVIVEDGIITWIGIWKLAARIFVDALVFCCSVAPILYIFHRRRSRQS